MCYSVKEPVPLMEKGKLCKLGGKLGGKLCKPI